MRWSPASACPPGGAQAAFDVQPDLSSFAKIVAGGLPGACVAGRKDILDLLDFQCRGAHGTREDRAPRHLQCQSGVGRGGHRGADGDRRDRCVRTRLTHRRRRCARKLNAVLAEEGVAWAVYGTYSGFHLFVNPRG